MKQVLLIATIFMLASCSNKDSQFDAQGTFEADETIVSSELPGKLLSFKVQEGDVLKQGDTIGKVDAENLNLQKQQVDASISSLSQKTADVAPQVKLLEDQLAVQQTQLSNLQHEKERVQRLLQRDAATGKQLDDINYQIEAAQKQLAVTRQQIEVQKNNVNTQNRSVLSESAPLQKRAAQLQDQVQRSLIINPINGTVITKYAEQGEVTASGKALYKIADLSTITLRAYITGSQLPQIKLGQQVTVYIDNGKKEYKTYTGNVTWVSDKAEFTPKTIQTKEERANLVYAIKIKMKNDGYLKIGMFGEVKLN